MAYQATVEEPPEVEYPLSVTWRGPSRAGRVVSDLKPLVLVL
jgi:hypothetical protein